MKCGVCKAQPIKLMPIGNKMNAQVKDLFQDPLEILKGMGQACGFQRTQNKITVSKMEKSLIQCKKNMIPQLQKQMLELKKQLYGVTKERDSLRAEKTRLEGQVQAQRMERQHFQREQQHLAQGDFEARRDSAQCFTEHVVEHGDHPRALGPTRVKSNYNVLEFMSAESGGKEASPTFKALTTGVQRPGKAVPAPPGLLNMPAFKTSIAVHSKRQSPLNNPLLPVKYGLAKPTDVTARRPSLQLPLVTPFRQKRPELNLLPMKSRPSGNNDTFQFPF